MSGVPESTQRLFFVELWPLAPYSEVECNMAESERNFYDELSGEYNLMFEDWEASIAHQAAALAPILERGCGPANLVRILDCACGIGTQALGLASRGFRVTALPVQTSAPVQSCGRAWRGRDED